MEQWGVPKLDNPSKEVLASVLAGTISILVSVTWWRMEEAKQARLPKEIQLQMLRRKLMWAGVSATAMGVASAVYAYASHRPSNNELAVAVLIEHLARKGHLDETVQARLRDLRPRGLRN